jgi:hypothetical protein
MRKQIFNLLLPAVLFVFTGGPNAAAALDLTGWTLLQSGDALTNSVPFGVSIQDNSYLVIARGDGIGGPTRQEFEAYWQVSLDPEVVYMTGDSLGGVDAFPQIGGESTQSYRVLDLTQSLVDGPTAAEVETRLSSNQRISLNTDSSLQDAWINRSIAFATPGYGCALSGDQARFVISEIADAEDNEFEYVEFFYGNPNSPDTTPPTPVDAYLASICNATLVRVVFSEDIDPDSGSDHFNYNVQPDMGIPDSASVQGNSVVLSFHTPLALTQTYEVRVQDILDTSGNLMSGPQSIDIFRPPLFLNELMYDPVYDLPFGGRGGDTNGDGTVDSGQDEFVEYINISGQIIDLSGYTLNDDKELRVIIPDGTLLNPGQALVVFGGGIPIGTFGYSVVLTGAGNLGLGNGGDISVLRDAQGRLVAHAAYSRDESDDESLQRAIEYNDAGWDTLCDSWVRHTTMPAAAGARYSPGTRVDGTAFPGSIATTPELLGAQPASPCDPTQVLLTFSRVMDTATGSDVNRYTIGELGHPTQAQVLNNTITLTMPGLQEWGRYEVSIDDVEDQNGTPTAPGTAAEFVVGTLVINEVLYHPPTGDLGDANRDGLADPAQDEFVEIVNIGSQPADLAGMQLMDANRTRFVFPEGTILAPNRAAVVFGGGDPNLFLSNFGGSLVFTTPAGDDLGLSDSNDTVTIATADHLVLTTMSYATDSPGMSLNLSPDQVCGLYFLHQWVAGSAGTSFSPGRLASGLPFPGGIDLTEGPPVVVDALVADASTIWLWFNEEVDLVDAEDPANYSLTGGGNVTFAILDVFERSVELALSTPLQEGVLTTVQVRNIADIFGNTSSDNGSVDVAYEPMAQIIINEILYDVPAGNGDANRDGVINEQEDEFVEFINLEPHAVDLSGWTVSDLAAQRHVFPQGTLLQPGQPLVLFGGGIPTGDFGGAIVQVASSGELRLGNTGDCLMLADEYGRLVVERCWDLGEFVEVSMVRAPEKTGAFTAHDLAPGSGGSLFSPGTQTDGTAFAFSTITPPVILTIEKGQAEGSIVLTFTGQPGPFAVEQSSSLTPPSWSEVQGVVFSVPDMDGLSTAEFTVGPEVTHNFFRIRQQ